MSKVLTEQRVHLTMPAEEVAVVDDWRRRQRDLPPRAEAIRHLVRVGAACENGGESALNTEGY